MTFEVECVWRGNMIMRDRETGTFWQHATGEALIGPLQGSRLALLGGELITWGGWKKAYPSTYAALEPEEWTTMVPRKLVMAVLEKATSAATLPGQSRRDRRLPAHETVIGLVVDGAARAYPLAALQEVGMVKEVVNGRSIKVVCDDDHDVVRAFAGEERLPLQRTWWAGWYEFHPQTTIYTVG